MKPMRIISKKVIGYLSNFNHLNIRILRKCTEIDYNIFK